VIVNVPFVCHGTCGAVCGQRFTTDVPCLAAQAGMERAAEGAIVAAELRVAQAAEAAKDAEERAASAAAHATAYQDMAQSQVSNHRWEVSRRREDAISGDYDSNTGLW
jgi:hypothetical protein